MKKPIFSRQLLAWYHKNARDLPWRKTRDPYKIWVSEIMLQQTTVSTVIPYYLKWVKALPTIQAVARTPLEKILRLWQGLGYYQRARNIHKSAKIISEIYKGKIPSDPLTLKQLPGFGPYTIGAILSIAFNQRYPIIDANVRRVVMRQLGIRGYAEAVHDKKILSFLERVMPQQGMSIFNQALMELGALVCRTRLPLCASCPVKNVCMAYEKGIQEIIPTPKKTKIKNVSAAVAVIRKNGLYLIQKRPAKGLLAGLWEFPGGKVEPGETPFQALSREIYEELGVKIKWAKPLMETVHFYTSFRVRLYVFQCKLSVCPKPSKSRKWVSLKSIQNYPLPSGSAKILDYLLERK